jgi:hypothetical protein
MIWPQSCGWRVTRMIPVSHMWNLGLSTAATFAPNVSDAQRCQITTGLLCSARPGALSVKQSGERVGGRLKEVEGRGVEEPEGDERQDPADLVNPRGLRQEDVSCYRRSAVALDQRSVRVRPQGWGRAGEDQPQVPELHAVVAVVDEEHNARKLCPTRATSAGRVGRAAWARDEHGRCGARSPKRQGEGARAKFTPREEGRRHRRTPATRAHRPPPPRVRR